MDIRCKLGFHKWESRNKPVVGRRNLSRTVNGVVMVEYGPEETFYPSEDGPIKPSRECIRCKERQSLFCGRWV